ncbi:MAG: MBOAT family protein [Clostridia bacterium]|nr:MBOAT family protein [Clostridia bacterium]
MSYVSIEFLLFFAAVFILYYILPGKFQKYILLLSSLSFFVISSKTGVVFVSVTTISIYLLGILIDKFNCRIKNISKELPKEERKQLKNTIQKKKKLAVLSACVINIGILLVLKYSGLFVTSFYNIINLFGVGKTAPTIKFLLPIGISYYTLMAISYIVDIYRSRISADKNFFQLLLYLTFFPYIVEGPISTYSQVSKQLFEEHNFDKTNIILGLQSILWGLFKKMVVADRAAIVVNEIFDNNKEYAGISVIIAVLLYTIQIYAEFSGCINIVSGISKMLGIDLPENFRQPFFSKSIQEFWRRWHITLGAWLKEYIFYSVSFSKGMKSFSKSLKKHTENKFLQASIPMLISMMSVWLIMGFWHGASWKYVVYGLYYYLIITLGVLFEPIFDCLFKKSRINRDGKIFGMVQILRTDFIVTVGLMMFRANTLSDMFSMLVSAIKNFNLSIGPCIDAGVTLIDFGLILVGVAIMFLVSIIEQKGRNISEVVLSLSYGKRYLIYFILIAFILFFGIYGPSYTMQPFVYGQF